MQSNLFTLQLLNASDGLLLANFWKAAEKEFVENMERCFFFRRILISELRPFVASIDKPLNETLGGSAEDKTKLVRQLQSDFNGVPYGALQLPDIVKRLHALVSDAKHVLAQMAKDKVETCKLFIKNENVENWIDKQLISMFTVYKFILQTEVTVGGRDDEKRP